MRRPAALALLAAAVLAALALYVLAPSPATPGDVATPGDGAPSGVAVPAGTSAVLEGPVEPRSGAPLASAASPARTEVAAPPSTPAPASDAAPRCVVSGTIVDEHGAPLAGARALLYAPKSWSEGAGAARVRPPHLAERSVMLGFEATSDAAGRFRLDVPAPANAWASLALVAGPLRDSATLRFGRGALGPLIVGERDVGTITLAATGALTGRVVDAAGRPLAGVELDLGTHTWSTLQRNTWSADDGRFVLGHAPRGQQHLKAKLDGYLSLEPMPVTIEAGRELDVGTLVLASAPTIEGTVRDAAGRPLAGARVTANPEGGGSFASADSGPDGRFVLHLPQVLGHTLAAKLDGHAPPSPEPARPTVFEPGARDVELVLVPLTTTRFLVIDDATGQPLERFGFEVLVDHGSEAARRWLGGGRRPPMADRAGGVVEDHAREGVDAYSVVADGYLPAQADVRHDVPGVPAQTIRLARGQAVRGRVVDGDAPVEGATVSLESWIRVSLDGNAPRTVGSTSALPTTTDADGAFALTGVAAGSHRLTVRRATGAPLVRIVQIERGVDLDLGDLALLPGATIVAELLVPTGVDPSGVTVRLGAFVDGVTASTDAAGRARFEDVAAGEHEVTAGALAGLLAPGAKASVTVEAGETAHVTIDARDRALCAVELTLLVNGAPAPGADVYLTWPGMDLGAGNLGVCDEDGRARGHARGGVEASVTLALDGVQVAHPTARLALEPLGRVEETVRFELGDVVVTLPETATLPAHGRASLELVALDAQRPPVRRSTELDGSREVTFTGVWPGRYALTLELIDADTKPDFERLPDGKTRVLWASTWTGRGDATVSAGQASTATVE